MDFSNRSTQPQPVAPSAHVTPGGPQVVNKKGNRADKSKWYRISTVVLVAVVVVLIIALAVFFAGNNGDNESSYVDTNKLQAVFLESGQVYFGNIKSINDRYAVLTNIFYLQTSGSGSSTASTSSSSSVSLVKLGCELHMPYDQMVINQNQITFWENLQSDGQVAKAVATFEKENPNGQKCSDQSSSSAATTNAVQSAPTTSASSSTTAKP